MGGIGVARTMTQSLDKKRSFSMMNLTCLTMGMHNPSLSILVAQSKPLHLCSVMLRTMSLMAAMHLWELYTEVGVTVGGGGASDPVCCFLLCCYWWWWTCKWSSYCKSYKL